MKLTQLSFRRLGRLLGAALAGGALFLAGSDESLKAAVSPATPTAAAIAGIARVVDGDTLEIGTTRVRLEGIDAPELAQMCTTQDGKPWPCGADAAKLLRSLTRGGEIACDTTGFDKYHRTLAICYADGMDVNAAMVQAGLAWAFVRYSQVYSADEAAARTKGIGIWQGKAEPAWNYRHKGWQTAGTEVPGGCPIKGNVSSKGRIYHLPWQPWYAKVAIDTARGERWFCSETEAIAAGWRPAKAS